MRLCFIVVSILMLSHSGWAQSKIYFNLGTNIGTNYFIEGFYRLGVGNRIFVTDTDYKSKSFGVYWNAELIIEKKINKILYGVTGLSWSQSGYSNSIANFFSDFNVSYLGIPLVLRVNFVNAVHLDVGFIGRIPIEAILEETGNQGTQFQTYAKENITSSLSKINLGGYLQVSFLINRFSFGFYLMGGQNTLDTDFENQWPLGNQSLFLRDIYPKFKYQMTGMKLGFRIK